jgi:NADH-quinone oxidoreductase subunit L
MTAPVAVLAVLSLIGGWIQFAPFWHPLTNWLEPTARPLVEPANWQEWTSSALALGLGLAGIAIAWAIYGARRVGVPRLAGVRRVLEHKLYFDELYDLAFHRPAVLLTRGLARGVEEPIVHGSIAEIGETTRDVARGASRLETGLLRSYALAIAGGVAVLIVVFVSVR